jgi:signal transduction histidine kinase/DNA-binding response OmpR family regulator
MDERRMDKSEEMRMGSILVVDDEKSIRNTVKFFLEDDGCQVETAEDFLAALDILREKPIDVVLTDIILPKASGLDLLKKIKDISPDVRVIMMTGEPTLETAAESLRFGAIDYLQKPVGKTEILKSIRNALHIKHLHDEKKRLEQENQRYTDRLEQLVAERTRELAESEAALRGRAEELSILNRLAREVGACMTVDATIQAGLREVVHATVPDMAVIFLRDEDHLVQKGLLPEGMDRMRASGETHQIGECLCGLAVGEDRPMYSIDIHSDERCTREECRSTGFSSFAALPLKSGTEILGLLGLGSVSPRDFGAKGPFLEALANEISIGLKKSLLYEQLQQHAMELQVTITQIKEGEAERLRLQAQLQQAQKMEAIGVLAGGIAHDFNNILAAVIGFTELSLGYVQKEDDIHRYLKEVLDAGLRAKSLVQQILTFSRKGKQDATPIHLESIAKEALKLLRASLPATIEIRRSFQSKMAVMADPTQIHQVLMNLCTNAAHAMREKGGVLEVSLTDVFLDSEYAKSHPDSLQGPHVRLAVRDTGKGMSQFVLERIFDPFFTTKSKGEGTGLGLSVVHGIVKSLKGHIAVSSRLDEGTSFEIFLPAVTGEDKEISSLEQSIPAGNEHILVVDDERSIVEANRSLLESLGYKVTGATGALEALEAFRSQPQKFDLVITDLTMPQMTGDKLAKALLSIRPDLPIILCSGFSASGGPKDIAELGIRALLHKPVLKREIAEAIRNALDA